MKLRSCCPRPVPNAARVPVVSSSSIGRAPPSPALPPAPSRSCKCCTCWWWCSATSAARCGVRWLSLLRDTCAGACGQGVGAQRVGRETTRQAHWQGQHPQAPAASRGGQHTGQKPTGHLGEVEHRSAAAAWCITEAAAVSGLVLLLLRLRLLARRCVARRRPATAGHRVVGPVLMCGHGLRLLLGVRAPIHCRRAPLGCVAPLRRGRRAGRAPAQGRGGRRRGGLQAAAAATRLRRCTPSPFCRAPKVCYGARRSLAGVGTRSCTAAALAGTAQDCWGGGNECLRQPRSLEA